MSELPIGWEIATFADVFDRLQYGLTAKASIEAGGPRFLRITDIEGGDVDWDRVPGLDGSGEIERYLLAEGDFVFARSGSIEKAARLRSPPSSVFASYLIRGRPIEPALGGWLAHFIWSDDYLMQIAARAAGIGMSNVSAEKLKTVTVRLPPLAEQRRIVAKLDALTARTARARADLDRIPALAARYKQAVLAKAFSGELTAEWRLKSKASWPPIKKPLALLCDPTAPICYGVVQPGSTSQGGIPLVRVCDLAGGTVDWPEVRTIEPEVDKEYSRSRIKNGDVLVTVVGTIGRVALVTNAPGSVNIARAVARVRPDATVVSGPYVFLALSAPEVQRELLSESREVARKTLNLEQLREIAIPVPSLQEQAQIVRVVSTALGEIDRLTVEAAAARRLLDRLDQAILAKAFRGELVPQDPSDEPASVRLERIRAERAAAPKARRGRKAAA